MSRYLPPTALRGHLVISNVTVVAPATGRATAGQDVEVEGGRIVAVSNSTESRRSDGTQLIDGTGRWLVPGFIDMHAHALNTPDDVDGAYALMLASGIVGFRQMSGSPQLLKDRNAGTLPDPVGAPALLATPGDLLTPMNAATPDGARRAVNEQKAQGADFIKAALVGRDAFLAALDEGRRLGISVAGHLPGDVDPREASRRGMRSIEHLGPGPAIFAATSTREADVLRTSSSGRGARPIPKVKLPGMDRVVGKMIAGIVVNPATRTSPSAASALRLADRTFDDAAAEELAAVFVANETWQCPTLVRVHTQQFPTAPEHARDPRRRYIATDELKKWDRSARKFAGLPSETRDALETHWQYQLRLTKVFADAGVPLLAGTDADGAGGVIPGFALHDEFDYLAAAGLDAPTILRTTTSEPARFLGRGDRAGRIAAGFDADLVLLSADPLADHRALRAIDGVIRDGKYFDSAALAAGLAAVEINPGAR